MYTIYLITNLLNGKYYVGQTKQLLRQRWTAHLCKASCPVLARAIVKYGREVFVVEPLTTASSKQEADNLERLWIIALKSRITGYNLTSGGDGRASYVPSKATRQKTSLANKGKHNVSVITRERLRMSHLGQKPWNKGMPWPVEVCKKMSVSAKKRGMSEEQKQMLRKARQLYWQVRNKQKNQEIFQ